MEMQHYCSSESLTILRTDLSENEALVKQMSEREARESPDFFRGKRPYVFYRVHYVPPFERFSVLRQLILQIKEAAGLRAVFCGIVALEMSEWTKDERFQEEYFSILLKYLYDHNELWKQWILVDCPDHQLLRFVSSCAVYLTPRVVDKRLYCDPERLERLIRHLFEERGTTLSPGVAEGLAERLISPDLSSARSLTTLNRIVNEVMLFNGNSPVLELSAIGDYLNCPDSLLAMLCGGHPMIRRTKL